MYPVIRMVGEMIRAGRAGPLPLFGTHVSAHRCWPQDIDLWVELNNGRTLTLLDLGRIPLSRRIGLVARVRARGWGMTVAGVSVRYRRRIRLFQRFEMRSRLAGWDARFFYFDQTMWNRAGECTTQALYRIAVVGADGIVAPGQVLQTWQPDAQPPVLPDWIAAWIEADRRRPWPPERV